MVAASSSITRSSIANDLSVLAAFWISGFLSGLLFAGLTTRPSLQRFWFIKGDKFLIPRYSYWIAFSVILLSGLTLAYSVTCFRRWFETQPALAVAFLLSARLSRYLLPFFVLSRRR